MSAGLMRSGGGEGGGSISKSIAADEEERRGVPGTATARSIGAVCLYPSGLYLGAGVAGKVPKGLCEDGLGDMLGQVADVEGRDVNYFGARVGRLPLLHHHHVALLLGGKGGGGRGATIRSLVPSGVLLSLRLRDSTAGFCCCMQMMS